MGPPKRVSAPFEGRLLAPFLKGGGINPFYGKVRLRPPESRCRQGRQVKVKGREREERQERREGRPGADIF